MASNADLHYIVSQIKGFFSEKVDRSELGDAASKAVANNITTTAAGSVLDARQGRAIKTLIDSTNTTVSQKANQTDLTILQDNLNTQVGSLNDSLTNLFPGGTNILRNTVGASVATSGTWVTGSWRQGGSGTGTTSAIAITDAPNPDITSGFEINKTEGTAAITAYQQFPLTNLLPAGYVYTLSCYARVTDGTSGVPLHIQYGSTETKPVLSSEWEKYSFTFTAPAMTSVANVHLGIAAASTTPTIQICGMKLELGNKATDWSPSPWDIENPNSEWTKLDLTSDFVAYNGLDANIPRYKKVGRSIHVKGVISPASANNAIGSATSTAATSALPSGYRPTGVNAYAVCQGSDRAKWLLTISTGGILNVSRYADETGYVTPSAAAWMPFYTVFAP